MPQSEFRTVDLICPFHGGPIPSILRKQDKHYRFVGACYIHSIMEIEEQNRCLKEYEYVEFPLVQ